MGIELSTRTVVVAVLVPFAFVAVRVYVVVDVGFTVSNPMRVDVERLPGVMATDDAFETAQLKVEVPFVTMALGEAIKEETVGGLLAASNDKMVAIDPYPGRREKVLE